MVRVWNSGVIPARHCGVVKLFKPDGGWGFIRNDDHGDLFFHVNDFVGPPPQIVSGETVVTFEVGTSRNGRAAAKAIEVIPVRRARR